MNNIVRKSKLLCIFTRLLLANLISLLFSSILLPQYAGGIIIPFNNHNIQIENIIIKVDASRGYGFYCIYDFKNYGGEINILMGFPNYISCEYDLPSSSVINNFKVYENNKEILTKISNIKAPKSIECHEGFLCWKTKFKKNEMKRIIIEYALVKFLYDSSERKLDFDLEMDSLWKGTIKYIEIFIDFKKLITPVRRGQFGIFEKSYIIDPYQDYYDKTTDIISKWDKQNKVLFSGDTLKYEFYNIVPNFEFIIFYSEWNELYPVPKFIQTNRPIDKQLLINIIYAKNGYRFKNKKLLEYFSNFDWYKPIDTFSIKKINKNDKKILKQIKNYGILDSSP